MLSKIGQGIVGCARRVGLLTGGLWLAGIAATILIGCGGVSPLASLNFVQQTLVGTGMGGGMPPTTTNDTGGLRSVCDLDGERRGIRMAVVNESRQFVRLSMTFLASAGPGGFVCAEEEQDYLQAGYREAVLVGGNTVVIGCDSVRLLSGTKILSWRVTDTLPQFNGGQGDIFPSAQPPLNGGTFIPLPELIVLGDDDPTFICTGNNLCTQRGFVYSDIANNTIASVNASRTQDTVCNARAGTAPEWHLGDLNVEDNQVQPFQYPSGANILVSVLDRASNNNASVNQVVWLVLDVEGNIIHNERR